MSHLIVAMTGASGAYFAELLLKKSPWPTILIASKWAQKIYAHECGPVARLEKLASKVMDNADMMAGPASGSVPTIGMVILPCSANTLGQISAGLGESLISRAAHCHLKERRPLILGLRETPLTLIDLQNAVTVATAGATVMPISPPFFMFKERSPKDVSLHDLASAYIERVLAVLGYSGGATWEDVR